MGNSISPLLSLAPLSALSAGGSSVEPPLSFSPSASALPLPLPLSAEDVSPPEEVSLPVLAPLCVLPPEEG